MHHYCTRHSQTTLPDARRKWYIMTIEKMKKYPHIFCVPIKCPVCGGGHSNVDLKKMNYTCNGKVLRLFSTLGGFQSLEIAKQQ